MPSAGVGIAELPNVQVLDFGMMDFVSAHNGAIPATRAFTHQFEHKRFSAPSPRWWRRRSPTAWSRLQRHARTEGRRLIYNDARRAHDEFGFLRQWSIYPAQIEPITRAMAPSNDEVEEAQAILLKAFAADWGPIQHEGNLHDRATYRYYWQQLQRANIQNVALGQEVKDRFFAEAVPA